MPVEQNGSFPMPPLRTRTDQRAVTSATTLADRLDTDFALINRNRSKGDAPGAEGRMEILVGDVRNKVSSSLFPYYRVRSDDGEWEQVAILIDDMCDTGGTIKLATNALIEGGARSVYAVVSHGSYTSLLVA